MAFTSGQELTKADEGDWYLHIYAEDSLKNHVNLSSERFRVNVDPRIYISATVGDSATPYKDEEWVNQPVHVTIQAEDLHMQDMHIKITHNGNEEIWTAAADDQFTFKRTFSNSGIYRLEIHATDASGLTNKAIYIVKISMDGLQLEVSLKQTDDTVLSDLWTNQPSVTASVYANNLQGASVTKVVYSLDNGLTWMPYGDTLIFTSEGIYDFLVHAEDEGGNIQTNQLQFGIDQTKPNIHFEPNGITHSGARYISSKVTVVDDLSGVAGICIFALKIMQGI